MEPLRICLLGSRSGTQLVSTVTSSCTDASSRRSRSATRPIFEILITQAFIVKCNEEQYVSGGSPNTPPSKTPPHERLRPLSEESKLLDELSRTAAALVTSFLHVPPTPEGCWSGDSCYSLIVGRPGPPGPPGRGSADRLHRLPPAGLQVEAGGFPQPRVRLRATRSLRPGPDASCRRWVSPAIDAC